MKKVLVFMLCFLLLGVQSTVADQHAETDQLTLDEALNMAYENNFDLQKAALQQEIADIRDDQMDKVRDLDDKLLTDLESKRQKYVTAKQAELGVDIADLSLEYTRLNTSFQVKNAFYQVILKQEELQKTELLKRQVTSQVEAAEKQYELGLISKLQLEQLKSQLEKVNLQLEQVKNESKQSKQELNLLIGQKLDQALHIEQQLEEPEKLKDLTVEELYQMALEHRPDVLQSQIDRDIKKINYDVTAGYYPAEIVYEHRLAKNEYQIAELEWQQKQKQTRIEVEKALDGYHLAMQSLNIAKQDLQLAEKMYQVAQTKYDQGLISQLDLLNEETSYHDAKINYLNSKYQAWMSIFQLEQTIGTSIQ
ncbi:MAG: TolC family protein [Bacillaceae bacterium]|nr:TolC family protein [Bacillaceae bacterium]